MMEFLDYDFVQRGLIAGVAIGISSAVAGVFLILSRMAFLGAGLSHGAFGGIALSMLLNLEPTLFTALFTLFIANLVQAISTHKRVPGDAAIALVFSGGVAIAVIVLGVTKGFGESVFGYLFGNILMVSVEEVYMALVLFTLAGIFFTLLYKQLVLISFSEEIAKLRGVNITLLNHLLISISSLVIVMAIKAVGIILASSMLVVPALTGLMLSGSFLSSLLISIAVSSLSVVGGMVVAFYYDLPPSGTIVGTMLLLFSGAFLRKIFKP